MLRNLMIAAGFWAFVAGTATAQETATPTATEDAPAATEAPADDGLSLGEEVQAEPQLGQAYAINTFGDWVHRCIKTEADQDPCHMYQLLRDADNNPVAEVTLTALPKGGRAVAGMNIVTPLETLLTAQLTVSVDGAAGKRYPFAFCSQAGCVARIGLTADDLGGFKRGNKGKVVLVPVTSPDTKVDLTMSLTGFTKAFEAVGK